MLQALPAMTSRCQVFGCLPCTLPPDQKARPVQVLRLVSVLPGVVHKQVELAGAISCLPPTLCGDGWGSGCGGQAVGIESEYQFQKATLVSQSCEGRRVWSPSGRPEGKLGLAGAAGTR